MALRVYSTQFVSNTFSTGGGAVLVVPDGHTWVIRDVTAVFDNDNFGGATVQVGTAECSFWQASRPTFYVGSAHWEGRVVLPAGEQLTVAVSGAAANGVDVTVSGYDLTTP